MAGPWKDFAPKAASAGPWADFKPASDRLTDVAKSAATGLGKGAIGIAGLGGDIPALIGKGLNAAAGRLFSAPTPEEKAKFEAEHANDRIDVPEQLPTAADIRKKVEGVTGPLYEPQTTAGKYASAVGEALPASVIGPGGIGAKLAAGVGAGLGGEAAGEATQGTALEPYARVAGALAGGLSPNVLSRVVTPVPSNAARQALVQNLENEGVTSLTAGQRTGNKALQYAESILGDAPGAGAGATRIQQEGQRQFTDAALRRAGAAGEATPEILQANSQRLGQNFEGLAARNNLVPDNQFITDITNGVQRYRNVPNSQQAQIVQGYIDDIVPHVNNGTMTGVEYQAMRSRLSRQSYNARNTDPDLSEVLGDMRNALDNAMGRSIAAHGAPGDQALWNQTRREYGAQRTIENAASRAGEVTAEGQITPANLRNVVAARNRGQYARGQGDFADLARSGVGVMSPLPNSGTGQRTAIQGILTALGGGVGSLAGAPGAFLGALAAGAAPAVAGRALMSRPVQAYLGNQLLRDLELPGGREAVLRALMTQERPLLENRGQ